jgi:hypothetical protein
MSNSTESSISPFMQEQLKFRSNIREFEKLTRTRERDSLTPRYTNLLHALPGSILLSFGLISYYNLRGQGVALELIKKRNPLYRAKLARLGITSIFFTSLTFWYLERTAYKFRFNYLK